MGDAFKLAIDGFSSNDWGIRNSSLMLFSVLAKKTFGLYKDTN